MNNIHPKQHKQRGGTLLGIIVGVLVGLGVALGVAVYVMKVPTPFNNKSASRTNAQDAAESSKNKDWDPNAAILGKPATKPADAASQATPVKALPAPTTAIAPTPAPTTPPTADVIEYYVQVGAYRNEDEAKAMRGKLALANFDGKVIEREQSGQKVFRVRVGPFANQAASDKAKASLDLAGFDTMVVRSQK
jgi:cell division protein FtsN